MPTTDELLKRIEALEQEQEKLQKQYQAAKQQNKQVLNLFEQFKSGSISRRAFLTSVSAVAGISWLAGSADAAPNWSNAAGKSGTESKPLKNVYAQNGTFQSVSTESLSHGLDDGTDEAANRSFDTVYQNTTGNVLQVTVRLDNANPGTDDYGVIARVGETSNLLFGNNTADYLKTSGGTAIEIRTISFIVEDGGYYDLATVSGNDAKIKNWWEREYK